MLPISDWLKMASLERVTAVGTDDGTAQSRARGDG